MRKVYQNEKPSGHLWLSVFLSLLSTAVLFGVMPFAHTVAKPDKGLELRKSSVADLPPPVEEELTPPPPEPEKTEEAAPEPTLTEAPQQQLALSADLEVAMGSGGALAGLGDVRNTLATEELGTENLESEEMEKQPQVISQTPPIYPRELAKSRISGSVRILMMVGPDGKVIDPRIENSSRPEFEKPALDAVRKWRFSPGIRDGQPVTAPASLTMRFDPPTK
ncbi:MAG: energy transducer TonB [Verrucomicrobiota bacterium]|nr:energy transducer TonB [Verrucomicrobiota bacterium]